MSLVSQISDAFVAVANVLKTKANTNNPNFTGTAQAPTPTLGTNNTQIATTAFVAGSLPGDATVSAKGLVQLAGDLGGTAAVPYVLGGAATYKNYVPNPSFEIDLSGWSAYGSYGSLTRDTTTSMFGLASWKHDNGTTARDGGLIAAMTLPSAGTYTFSVYAKMSSTVTNASMVVQGGSRVLTLNQSYPGNTNWNRYTGSFTIAAGQIGSYSLLIGQGSYGGASQGVVNYDGFMVELGSPVSTYFDGDTVGTATTTYAWSGTAGNSVSTKQTRLRLQGTDQLAEGTANLYFTTARASAAAPIQSITTTGTSGAAALSSGVLNIPTYTAPDATTTTKGIVQLAGDLGGTAAAPTVPGLSLKAPLASPAFTGTPSAPSPTAGDSTTTLATTAFVTTADNLKAPLASPALTGAPTAPTVADTTDSTTKIATTGFIGALVGQPIDWAARLTAGLTPVSTLSAATNTIPGITRFATASEAAAATLDTVAMTPAQVFASYRANPRRFASLAVLFASTQVEGAIASVDRYTYSTGILHRESVWHSSAGQWYPVGNQIFVEAADNAGAFSALNSIISDVSASNSKAFVPPGCTGINIINGNRWRWTGTKWALATGTVLPSFYSGYADWDTTNTPPTWKTSFSREGRLVAARFAVARTDKGTWPSTPVTVISIPDGYRPTNNVMCFGATYNSTNGSFNGTVTIEVTSDGNVKISSVSAGVGNINGIFGSTAWEAID